MCPMRGRPNAADGKIGPAGGIRKIPARPLAGNRVNTGVTRKTAVSLRVCVELFLAVLAAEVIVGIAVRALVLRGFFFYNHVTDWIGGHGSLFSFGVSHDLADVHDKDAGTDLLTKTNQFSELSHIRERGLTS